MNMQAKKRLIVIGGSGFIGQKLSQEAMHRGYEVICLTRNPEKARKILGNKLGYEKWDGRVLGNWVQILEGAYAVVNLVGENISAGRWTEKRKKAILESRIETGKLITRAFESLKNKVQTYLQASAVGYYGDRKEEAGD